MLIGYARVSTIDQNPALQMDALKTAGCDKVFTEKASGSHRDRPQLKAALNYLREGDTLVVWKLSRLARSLTQVIKTATDINDRGIALKMLTQNIDTSTSEGRLFFHMIGRVASITGQARSTLTRENGQPTDSNLAQPSSVILLRARTPICASVF